MMVDPARLELAATFLQGRNVPVTPQAHVFGDRFVVPPSGWILKVCLRQTAMVASTRFELVIAGVKTRCRQPLGQDAISRDD